jgi:penicillin-binding protein 1A
MFDRVLRGVALQLAGRDWAQLKPLVIREYERHKTDLEYVPPLPAQELLVAGEDHRFFSHPGVDPIAICRAVWRRVAFGKIEGASMIAQQLVRVLTGRYEQTLYRKFKEMVLAVLITTVVPKSVLPSLYLRIGYFGWRMNGFREACRRLGFRPDGMTLLDCAELVARLKYPEPRLAPSERMSLIRRRATHLLKLRRQKHRYLVRRLPAREITHEPV